MTEPTFENTKVKFEKFLKCIINQSVKEFQENHDITIDAINIELVDITEQIQSPIKVNAIKQIKLTISL